MCVCVGGAFLQTHVLYVKKTQVTRGEDPEVCVSNVVFPGLNDTKRQVHVGGREMKTVASKWRVVIEVFVLVCSSRCLRNCCLLKLKQIRYFSTVRPCRHIWSKAADILKVLLEHSCK